MAKRSGSVFSGPWANSGKGVKRRYLGVRFKISGQTHYGWARLNVRFTIEHEVPIGRLTGYAYETIPNKPIITGKTKGLDVIVEPATPGHLAQGASGRRIPLRLSISRFRRRIK